MSSRRPARRGLQLPVLALAVLLAGSACSSAITSLPQADALAARAVLSPAPRPAATTPPTAAATNEDAEIQRTLDRVADAFRSRDPEALRPWLDDPSSPFGRRWLERAGNLRDVPLSAYSLELDPLLPDMATNSVRARLGPTAQVRYVLEKHAIEGFDSDGPGTEDLFLTFVRRPESPGAEQGQQTWRVAEDADAEGLGLVSVDHLWDHGPVVALRDGSFLALFHPGSEADARALLQEARGALEDMQGSWPLPWSHGVPLVIPRDQAELGELLHATFDLSNFLAFATSNSNGRMGDFQLTGSRVMVNPDRLLARPSDLRRRILAHELLHVATRPESGPMVPAWVEEGLAQRLGERQSTTGIDLLATAVAQGSRLQPPEDAAFNTGGSDQIFLSYQLAWSLANYIAATYGESALARFYQALGRGAVGEPGRQAFHVDRAAREAFGKGMDALRLDWMRSLQGG